MISKNKKQSAFKLIAIITWRNPNCLSHVMRAVATSELSLDFKRISTGILVKVIPNMQNPQLFPIRISSHVNKINLTSLPNPKGRSQQSVEVDQDFVHLPQIHHAQVLLVSYDCSFL